MNSAEIQGSFSTNIMWCTLGKNFDHKLLHWFSILCVSAEFYGIWCAFQKVCWSHRCNSIQGLLCHNTHNNVSNQLIQWLLFFRNFNPRSMVQMTFNPTSFEVSCLTLLKLQNLSGQVQNGNASMFVDTVINFAKFTTTDKLFTILLNKSFCTVALRTQTSISTSSRGK